jgi:hypothetical protein
MKTENKNKWFNDEVRFAFIVLLLSIGIVAMTIEFTSAISNTGCEKFEKSITFGKPIPLVQYCANCTYVNVSSITYPNGTLQLINLATQKSLTTFTNDTYLTATQVGDYVYETFGDLNGNIERQCLTRNVSTTGDTKDLYVPLILGIAGFLLFIIAFISKSEYVGLFSAFIFIVLGLYLRIYGFGSIETAYTQMFSWIILGFGLIIGFSSLYEMYDGGED